MRYALDTNIVIHLLRNTPSVQQKFSEAVERGDELMIPPLVHYEMWRGFRSKSAPAKENVYRILIARYPVGEMNTEILEYGASLYADMRRVGRTVDDMDLLIAAFCVTNEYTLVTHNTRHFEGINGLLIEDWAE